MLENISIELINKAETFSVVFTKNKIEYEAIIQSVYTEINPWTKKEILNIQLNGNEVELNLTESEEQEILNYCE